MKTGKIVRPKLELKDTFVDERIFAFFEHSWRSCKALAGTTDVKAKQELGMYLSDEVSMLVWGKFGVKLLTEDQLLAAIREVPVRTRNRMVTCYKLIKMVQSQDQPIQAFVSNLKAAASLCEFKVKCKDNLCRNYVDFKEQMVMEQFMVRMADKEPQ